MNYRLTCEAIEDIKDTLRGTCRSVHWALAQHDLDGDDYYDEVNDRLLDGGVGLELCGGCEWWHDVCDLVFDEEREKGFCEQCEPELHGIEE